jgi:dienelactone hydrolase
MARMYVWIGSMVCRALVLTSLVSVAAASEPAFRLHTLNSDSAHNACAVFDVNRDGRLDVVAGGWWYEAPDWKRHFVREVEMIRGRYDDYSHLPLDINGDGWLDLISANYRSQSIYWVEHPGPSLGPWRSHVVDRPGAMETGRLADIDGDGRLDLLPNGLEFAAWWEINAAEQTPKWVRHELPREIAGHGIGFGDLDGDGRGDIVASRGWLKAPADPRTGRWVFRPEFRLDRDGSIPILVLDVDQDGDNDIVWGRGHTIGLYWLEQKSDRAAGANSTWERHAIDTSWSQPHSILLADIDSDGQQDLVAGKRYMGHDGKDPGEFDPLVAYWYTFDVGKRVWRRNVISAGSPAGFGLDPKAADLDDDGDTDIVVSDRSGLYWFEQLSNGTEDAAPGDSPQYSSHDRLMVYLDDDGEEHPIEKPIELGIRRSHILAGMQRAMGSLPDSSSRVPLDLEMMSETDTGNYLRRKITFSSESNDRVPAYLLVPKNLTKPTAAMLCLHQATRIGKDEPAGLGGKPSLHYAHELAERGYICIVPDYPSFGDYAYEFETDGAHHASGSIKAVWNNIRCIDVLETLEQVDRDKIGCIGHSLGGHNGLFTAVFDQRIQAVVTSCGFTAFHHYYGGDLAGWTSPTYMPRIRDQYDSDSDRVPFDFYEVLAAIAPRAVFVNAPQRDSNFELAGVKAVVDGVQQVYDLRGAGDQLKLVTPDAAHDFPDEIREASYDWLDGRLQQ